MKNKKESDLLSHSHIKKECERITRPDRIYSIGKTFEIDNSKITNADFSEAVTMFLKDKRRTYSIIKGIFEKLRILINQKKKMNGSSGKTG